mmetsp:Transcript_53764/g.114203  ORF Transcript_53764/g.114203 Transcript_53764/m.114203 type:complete len:202 (-) Transcript_53764:510-1115(-)
MGDSSCPNIAIIPSLVASFPFLPLEESPRAYEHAHVLAMIHDVPREIPEGRLLLRLLPPRAEHHGLVRIALQLDPHVLESQLVPKLSVVRQDGILGMDQMQDVAPSKRLVSQVARQHGIAQSRPAERDDRRRRRAVFVRSVVMRRAEQRGRRPQRMARENDVTVRGGDEFLQRRRELPPQSDRRRLESFVNQRVLGEVILR